MNTENQNILNKEEDLHKLISRIFHYSNLEMPKQVDSINSLRLQHWLNERMIFTFEDYCEYLFLKENSEEEIKHMVDIITTLIEYVK